MRLYQLIYFAAGLISGALLFYIFSPTPSSPDHNDSPAIAPLAGATETDTFAPNTCGPDLTECQQTLREVRDAHEDAIKRYSENEELVEYLSEIVARTSPDQPIEFPEQLDEQFHPERFEEAVAKLMQACPDVLDQDTRADCSEYPCIIEYRSHENVEPRELSPLSNLCPALKEYLPSTNGAVQYVSQVAGETWIQHIPYGAGIGLADHIQRQRIRLLNRGQKRWEQKRQALNIEAYEDACLNEHDIEACRELATAFHNDPDQRELYGQIGCDAGDARACYLNAYYRCISGGRCDATAEHYARQALQLDDESQSNHKLMATILCERRQQSQAAHHFQRACTLGDESSCAASCSS